MKPKCRYPNAQSLVYEVHRWIKDTSVTTPALVARPHNRYKPIDSLWWLIPSTEWPAYRYAKLMFVPQAGPRELFCGLHVEKGVSPSVADAYPTGKRLVMQDDWAWHRFTADLKTGAVQVAILEIVSRCGTEVEVGVHAGLVEDPGSYDPQGTPMDWQRAVFETTDGALTRSALEGPGDFFAELAQSQDLAELADALKRMPSRDWCWVNLTLGIRLEMTSLEHTLGQDAEGWRVSELWTNCLAPWRPWII